MEKYKRKISKEIYDRAMLHKGYLASEDMSKVFNASELMGYGVYVPMVFERDGEYYVSFEMGSSCD